MVQRSSNAWAYGLLAVHVLAVGVARAEGPTRHDVAMRDGVKLATDVYLPAGGAPWPAILARTPYGRSGGTGFAAQATARDYAVVFQDLRGRGDSEGHHAIIFSHGGWGEHRDGYDTVEWIAQLPWCDGNVVTWGGSALGITQTMLAPSRPPHLRAQHVVVACGDFYRHSAYPGGAWRQSMLEGWLEKQGMTEVNLESYLAHPNYDAFWHQMNAVAQADKVNVPALFIGGWYDIFAQGTIDSFVSIQQRGDAGARSKCRLVMGPLAHGPLTELSYPNARLPQAADAFRWFDHWVKGVDNGVEAEKPVHYYVMGDPEDPDAPGNVWRQADTWPPPATVTPYYFHTDGVLSTEAPSARAAARTYRYDPKNPVPTIGGANLLIAKGPMDQRSVEGRADVLVFTSSVLESPLEVTGRIWARLWVSSSARDTDFTVKLCDVYPDGRSMLVTDGILRARHRKSMAREDFLEMGEVYRLDVDLWSTSLIFNRGHRIRVAVSSSNAPRFAPNPNSPAKGPNPGGVTVAVNTLRVNANQASGILLPVGGGKKLSALSFQQRTPRTWRPK